MTTKAELKALVEQGVVYVNKVLIEDRQKELIPMFHLIAPPGRESAVVGTPWNGDLEKQIAVAQVKSIAHDMDAQAVVFTTECWMLVMPAPLTPWHAKQERPFVRPSESPDRIEAVLIIARNKAGDIEATGLQMIRDKPGGKLISLVPMTDMPGSYESWMFDGMFNPTED